MAHETKGVALGPDALASLMIKLDEVMAEAVRLRDEVSRQLARCRSAQQQLTQPVRKKRVRTAKR
jgi:hypothetical protein